MFIVDYALEEGGETHREVFASAVQAEQRARRISKKHHKGGYDGPLVYVFREHSPNGQRAFFAGRTDWIDGEYLQDRDA